MNAVNPNQALVDATTEKIVGQIAPILEAASGGQIKVIKSKDEEQMLLSQSEAAVSARLESSPDILELVDLEQKYRQEQADAEKAAVATDEAAPADKDTAPVAAKEKAEEKQA